MNNNTLQIKIKQRLNKLDSNDYDNVKDWQIVEAFNKAQIEWCRRQLRGTNARQEGDEQSKRRIDDLEILIVEAPLTGADVPYNDTFGYFLSNNFEAIYDNSYLEFKRIRCNAKQIVEFNIAQVQEATCEDCKTDFGHYLQDGASSFNSTGIAGGANFGEPIGFSGNPLGETTFCRNCNYTLIQEWVTGAITDPIQALETLPEHLNPWCTCCDRTYTNTPGDGLSWLAVHPNNPQFECIPEDITTYTQETRHAPNMDKEKCCEDPRTMTVYLSEVGNVDMILRDSLKNPNWDWAETYCTLRDHEIRIWRKDFWIVDPHLIYYRKPRRIQIANSVDPYTGATSAVDVECEFKNDIVENILDDTIGIIAGDISDANNMMRGQQQSEKNN